MSIYSSSPEDHVRAAAYKNTIASSPSTVSFNTETLLQVTNTPAHNRTLNWFSSAQYTDHNNSSKAADTTFAMTKPRCSFFCCKKVCQPIMGTCSFCGGAFCHKHRQLEDHCCAGLDAAKRAAYEKNAKTLEKERTIVRKV